MSEPLYAIPVTRSIEFLTDYEEVGVIRHISREEARASLLPLLPEGYPWPPGEDGANWRAPDGSSLEVTFSSEGNCVFIKGSDGEWGIAGAAIRRIANLAGWSVVDLNRGELIR